MGKRVAWGLALAIALTLGGAPAALAAAPTQSNDSLLGPITVSIPPLLSLTLFGEEAPDAVTTPEEPAVEQPAPVPSPTPTTDPVVPPPAAPAVPVTPPVSAPAPSVPATTAAPETSPAGKAELPTAATAAEAAPTDAAPLAAEGPGTVSSLTDADAAVAGRLPNGGSGREDLTSVVRDADGGLSRMLAPALAVSTCALASLAGGAFFLHQRMAENAAGHGRRRATPEKPAQA